MIVILLQRGRGGGLSGAFGGAGGSSAFGAKTGDVFTWITVVVAAVFLLLAVVGNYVFDASEAPVVAAPPTEEITAPVPPDEGGEIPPAGEGDQIKDTPSPPADGGKESPRPESEGQPSSPQDDTPPEQEPPGP
jgi:preprotein translocase subunit SecG